jgi:protocatechuate 3,4-dioxygenase beta subunit
MRPAQEIGRLLAGLEDHTSAAFDERTLRDMFSALDTSLGPLAARSGAEVGRSLVRSRLTRLATAAVLVLALLLLVRYLTGLAGTVRPGRRDGVVAKGPRDKGAPAPVAVDPELEQVRRAQELFARADGAGLITLLDTGLDRTRIVVAGYLAQIGDESALPALEKLAERWQGPAEDNPFRKSVEQIRSRSSRRGNTDVPTAVPAEIPARSAATAAETPVYPPAPEDNHLVIAVRVGERETGMPIPQAPIRTWVRKAWETNTSDDQGRFALDVGEAVPSQVMIVVRPPGYVGQSVELRNLSRQNLPKTMQFALDKGTVIGGVVQDGTGRPIPGVSVESYIQEPQRFDQPHISVSIKETTDAQGRWRSNCVPAQVERLWFNVYHPDFADGGFEMPRALTLDDLRAQRAVMILHEGLAVTGRVTDAAGHPIAEADLLAGEDYFARDWTKTDAAGNFRFPHLRTINTSFLLTVQAKGFAPQRRELPAEPGLAPVEFILQPAKFLLGRVIDGAGRPVAGAFVVTERWNRYRTVRWQSKTDAQGRFTWDYPPADAIEVRVNKEGFREITKEVIADGREQTFVLTRPVTIQGSVTDSQTGAPVNRFKVTPGIQWPAGDNHATWQTSEGWVRWFTEGRYSYTFTWSGRAFAVRVEAEGYLPVESRFVDANEPQATIDIALTKGQGPSGRVLDANGLPVAGAEVYWEKIMWVENGAALSKNGRVYVKTDQDGHFAFRPENRQDAFVALGDRGMGIALYDDLARDGVLTLTPWARVQGTLRLGTRPAAQKRLQLDSRAQLPGNIQLSAGTATTDDQGRFVFERVCPGEFQLYHQTYEIRPGQTLELHLGGTGRTVQGVLALPDSSDVPIWANIHVVLVRVPIPFDQFPKPPDYERMSRAEVQVWLERFAESPEGKASAARLEKTYPQTGRSPRVEVENRRAFLVDNVAPGVYALRGAIYRSAVHEGTLPVIGRLWYEFAVPPLADASPLDVPLELGALAVLPGQLKPGDSAPDFDVPTFGPERLRLRDYRGQVLLMSFVNSDYLQSNSSFFDELKSVYRRFRANPRYAQIGLLFPNYYLPLDKKAVEEAGLDWPHGLVEPDGKESTEYGIPASALQSVLIGPHGEILGFGLSGETLMQTIEVALRISR